MTARRASPRTVTREPAGHWSIQPTGLSSFRRVEYDIERTTQAILASDLPNVFADQLREARGYANPIVAVP